MELLAHFSVKNKEVSWTKELKASLGRSREGAKMVDTKGECWWLITALTKQPFYDDNVLRTLYGKVMRGVMQLLVAETAPLEARP